MAYFVAFILAKTVKSVKYTQKNELERSKRVGGGSERSERVGGGSEHSEHSERVEGGREHSELVEGGLFEAVNNPKSDLCLCVYVFMCCARCRPLLERSSTVL